MHDESKTLGNLCLHVESVKLKLGGKLALPEYNCLLLSPANLWQQNRATFQEDPNLLGTIFNYQNLQKGKISIAEMLFGMNLKDTGIKRYPLRSRQRLLQYSITIVLQHYDPQFIEGLKHKLISMYPLHSNQTTTLTQREIWHIYYPGEFNFKELVPLAIAYTVLFLYVYFSVRKMELVKSKIGIAISAVVTTAASLAMSVGLCFFFGLRLTLDGREVLPYVVVAVGFENVLVLTKSVVSTPAHLDVKIRVAQGLSKEGWNITKNLLTLVLAIDIDRTELSEPAMRALTRYSVNSNLEAISAAGPRLSRSKSHPRLNSTSGPGLYPTNVVAFPLCNTMSQLSQTPAVPKRLRLMHFWARTRIFQRAFMLCMVVWIGAIAYNAGLVQKLAEVAIESNVTTKSSDFKGRDKNGKMPHTLESFNKSEALVPHDKDTPQTHNVSSQMHSTMDMLSESKSSKYQQNTPHEYDLVKLQHTNYEPWRMLSQHHWAAILGLYNISSAGHYISILPPITLSLPVSPEQARLVRNVNEKGIPVQSQWQVIVAALDPLDFSDGDIKSQPMAVSPGSGRSGSEVPYVPQSPMELFLTAVLCIISVLVLAYFMVVLYRCVCTRNYAEWRASWEGGDGTSSDSSTQVVLEAKPIVLEGHPQQVECLATDGSVVVSSCLAGEVRVWDVFNGENLATIDRKKFFAMPLQTATSNEQDLDDLPLSDYESGSPPSRGEGSNTALYHYEQEGREVHNCNSRSVKHMDSWMGGGHSATQRSAVLVQQETAIHHCDNSDAHTFIPNTSRRQIGGTASFSNKSYITDAAMAYYKKTDDIKWKMTDLRPNINTNFSSPRSNKFRNFEPGAENGYDFTRYRNSIYDEDSDDETYIMTGSMSSTSEVQASSNDASVPEPPSTPEGLCEQGRYPCASAANVSQMDPPPVWCMDCQENLVVLGCANGRLEFWEASTGAFKCLFEDHNGIGVTAIKIIGNRVVVAKLSGCIDFCELESHRKGKPVEWSFTSFRRTHIRTGSAGSLDWEGSLAGRAVTEELRCLRIATVRAHQQPITVLDSEGGRILSGSQDHTLKVFRLEDQLPLYTLHGHCGPITALFIDKISPMMSGSGRACMYSLQAHDGSIVALSYSASYVLSLGVDERLCAQSYCCSMVMLTHNLLITSKQDCLLVWDVRRGEPVRAVRLGHAASGVFVQHLIALHDSVVCDYGSQLRVVRFPLVAETINSD
ncbi:hypothetical protein B566_EDAN013377 [Ephemera danica]|nr:hypothetical protein B566_EDAN013377 [Ephemera danica]